MNTLSRYTLLLGLLLVLGVSLSLAQPTISGLSAQSGKAGTSFTITGTNFDGSASNDVVRIGGVKAAVTGATATSLTVTVPTNAVSGIVTVTVTPLHLTAYWSLPFSVTYVFPGPIDTASFAPSVGFAAGTAASIAFAGDFDGDGKTDIGVVNNGDNTISLYLNTSSVGSITSASFGSQFVLTTGQHPWGVAVADIDGDGKLDIVVCNGLDSTISVFRNTSSPGSFSFDPKVDFKTGYGPHDIVVADFNLDGRPDVVVSDYAGGTSGLGTISVLRNVSTGSTIAFTKHIDIPVGDGPRGIAAADMDGDGYLDLAVANFDGGSISLFQNQSKSTPDSIAFIIQHTENGFLSPDAVAFTDVDGDGVPDVIAGGAGDGLWLYRGDATWSFESAVLYHKGSGQGNVLGIDMNGDGKPDVVTGNALESPVRVGTVSILQNATVGIGTFSSASLRDSVNYLVPSLNYGVAVADVDGDGRPDLISANYYTKQVGVLRSRLSDAHTITPTVTGPGAISPPATFTIYHGHDTTFTITANGGSHVDSVVVDGVNQYVLPTYTFTNVTSNHTIKAYFSSGAVFAITSSAGANGTISPNGTVNVPSGGTQAYTITPNSGYGIATVLVDGSPVANTAKYTFTNVLLSHTISATFSVGVNIPLKVFLQGPAAASPDTMLPTLRTSGTLAAHFTSVPIPSNAIDSINVELRNAQTTAGSTTRKFQPAWLLSNGTITSFTDTTKNYVRFDTSAGSYYIVVRHRNHLAVMSAAAIALTSTDTLAYDFTTGQAKAFGTNPMAQVGTKFCMIAGDANADGQITTLDFSPWLANAKAALTGYYSTDMNCDGQNTTLDFTLWLANAKSAPTSQVP